jgi:hypothetical protein
MEWQKLVPACFGNQDCIFAVHPMDEQRAKEAIKAAKPPVHHAMTLKKRWSGTCIRKLPRRGSCSHTSKNRLPGCIECGGEPALRCLIAAKP